MNPWRGALVTLLLAATAAWAGAPNAAAQGSEVSMDQAVKMVERQYHARVVKAETQQLDGRSVYVLRLLNDAGRVWTVQVDAHSGAVR